MKKQLLIGGLTAAVLTLIPASASAHSYQPAERDAAAYEMRCDRIAERITHLNAAFDQTNDHRLLRQQKLIDRQSHLGCQQPATVVDALVENGNFTTLVTAVTAAGLGDTLSAPGNMTVFAPTDAAFAALPAGTVESLLADVPALQAILKNHVVGARADAVTALQMGNVQTLGEANVPVTAENGFLYVAGVKVVLNDIHTGNGVVHVLDAVILQ